MRKNSADFQQEVFVIKPSDWVNVIAVTPQQEVILVKQFRQGTQEVTLEIPGGMVDPGESPLQTAQRELEEETGYVSQAWSLLGSVRPNPAIQDNFCYTFLAEQASPDKLQSLGPAEELEIVKVPLLEIPPMIASGLINHALVIVAFCFLSLARSGFFFTSK
ncbi:MAG: NUDIX hydrolase [Acidobacteriota bacterium]|nr:NUDIX hydrolase [Blastocatellia bacterium]MDW8413748.1 NUDIX hydrolase [Acidobacteriota bacterium]